MGGWDNYGRGFMRPDHSVPAIMESGLTTLNDVQSHSMTSPLDRHDLLMPQYMVNRLCREKVRLPSINATFQEGWLVRGGKDKSLTAMGADPATASAAGLLATNFN